MSGVSRFTVVRLREAYDIAEVDGFLERIEAALSEGPRMTPDDVRGVRFKPVRVRPGYDMGEVDRFLDEVGAELGRRGTAAPGEQAAPGRLSTAGAGREAPAPTASVAAPERREDGLPTWLWVTMLVLAVVLAVVLL
jgi:DivIVA domain-containing protein